MTYFCQNTRNPCKCRGFDSCPKRGWMLTENIMNVVVFTPVVILLGITFKQMTWWEVLLIGCSISITIEALQFCFLKGFSEVDDVMHNTVGCLVGWLVVKGSRLVVKVERVKIEKNSIK